MAATLLLAAILLLVPAGAGASYFCDALFRSTPTGRLRLYAVSGKTRPLGDCQRRAIDNQLRFLLVDAATDRPRWSIDSPEKPGPGAYPNVHDSGWVVLERGSWVVGIEPAKGYVTFQIDLKDHLPDDVWATWGYKEERGLVGVARTWFEEIDKHLYFVKHTQRGRFIVVDLVAGKLVEPPPPELATALLDAEERWVRDTLAGAPSRLAAIADHDRRDHAEGDVWTAMRIAALRRMADVAPDLRALEGYESVSSWVHGDCASREGILLDGRGENGMRLIAQTALRHLGERPGGRSPLTLARKGEEFTIDDPLASVKDRRPEALRKGMAVSEVLRLVGTPDATGRKEKGPGAAMACEGLPNPEHPYWDYIIDAAPSWKLRIWWELDGQVADIERLASP